MAADTGFCFADKAGAVVERGPRPAEPVGFSIGGLFHVECYDADGNLKWKDTAKNGVTNQGLNSVLDVYLHAVAAITSWFIGLINNSPAPSLAAGDTLASHAGWSESTAYTGNRPEWTEGAASSQAITNASTVDFAITGTVTMYGLFLASVATGTSGTLFATAAFSGGTQAVASGDTLKVTYTVSAASG